MFRYSSSRTYTFIKQAKQNCDYFIVGLNNDKSVKRLKGENRPINKEEDTIFYFKSIRYVDEVIIFEEDTPLNLIKKLNLIYL